MPTRINDAPPKTIWEFLAYSPDTGHFTWVKASGRRVKGGDRAGKKTPHGYISIKFCGRSYFAHRLAWLFVHGDWPSTSIDHINRVKDDNRIENLRVATHQQNCANRLMPGPKLTGVSRKNSRYRAEIKVNDKHYHLGMFDTPEAAHSAYLSAARSIHGDFLPR